MERTLKQKLKAGKFQDVHPIRSKIMASIKGKHNKSTERKLRMAFVKAGLKGWVLHSEDIFGKPDFFFEKKRIAVFVDGCFWHGCRTCGHIPKTRSAFWKTKFERNQARAKLVKSTLRQKSIRVMRIWEHELKESGGLKRIIKNILESK